MKIVIIGTNASTILGFRKDLILKLISQGHTVFAFAIDYSLQEKEAVKSLGAIPFDYSLSRAGLNPFSDIKTLFQLKKLLITINPDIVFSYFSKPVILGTLAARLAKVPKRIGMLEGLGYTFTPQPKGVSLRTKMIRFIQVFLYRLSFFYLDKIILLNNDDYNDLIKNHHLKVKNVCILGPIGLNLKDYPYTPAPVEPISFIFIGRLLAEKGIHEYVSAAKIIKKKYPNVEFIVLGGLDEENPGGLSKKQLELLISDGLITYPGHVSNVKDWITKASVFILPSYREGAPRSTQEAMAIGRAVITTDAPGCKDTVLNETNGFLIPRYDINALANKIEYFIQNRVKIIQMGTESHKIALKKFDADEVNLRLTNFITS